MNIKLVSFYAIGCCSKIVFNHDYGGKGIQSTKETDTNEWILGGQRPSANGQSSIGYHKIKSCFDGQGNKSFFQSFGLQVGNTHCDVHLDI